MNGVVNADFFQDLNRDDIAGFGECRPEKCRSEKPFFIILRLPVFFVGTRLDADVGCIKDQLGRIHAMIQCRGIDEGFKSGPRLTSGLNGPVELAFIEVTSSNQALYPPRSRIHANQSTLRLRLLSQRNHPGIGRVSLPLQAHKNDISCVKHLGGFGHFNGVVRHLRVRLSCPFHGREGQKTLQPADPDMGFTVLVIHFFHHCFQTAALG